MLSRRNWITEFIGHVLRRGMSDDPDSAFDTASELHSEWGDFNPEFAADSVLCRKASGRRQRGNPVGGNLVPAHTEQIPPRAGEATGNGLGSVLDRFQLCQRLSLADAAQRDQNR